MNYNKKLQNMWQFTAWQVLVLSTCIMNVVYSDTSDCLRSALTCSDITFEGEIWGYNVSGLLIGEYTEGIEFIGCVDHRTEVSRNCQANDGADRFQCTDNADGSLYFGSNVRQAMVSLFDTGSIPDTDTGCATETSMAGFSRLAGTTWSIQSLTLCQQLGYEHRSPSGPIGTTNSSPMLCPVIKWNNVTGTWELEYDVPNINHYTDITCSDPCATGSPTQYPTQIPTESTGSPTQKPSDIPTTAPFIYTTDSASDSDSDSDSNDSNEESAFRSVQNVLKHDSDWNENGIEQQTNDNIIKVMVRLDAMSCLGLVLFVLGFCSAPFVCFFITAKSNY
eukprot:980895_1